MQYFLGNFNTFAVSKWQNVMYYNTCSRARIMREQKNTAISRYFMEIMICKFNIYLISYSHNICENACSGNLSSCTISTNYHRIIMIPFSGDEYNIIRAL